MTVKLSDFEKATRFVLHTQFNDHENGCQAAQDSGATPYMNYTVIPRLTSDPANEFFG